MNPVITEIMGLPDHSYKIVSINMLKDLKESMKIMMEEIKDL